MFSGGKGGWSVGLTTLPPSCADCLEIWNPKGLSRLVMGYCFTFTFTFLVSLFLFFLFFIFFFFLFYIFHTSSRGAILA
jgi:hypothetical protein